MQTPGLSRHLGLVLILLEHLKLPLDTIACSARIMRTWTFQEQRPHLARALVVYARGHHFECDTVAACTTRQQQVLNPQVACLAHVRLSRWDITAYLAPTGEVSSCRVREPARRGSLRSSKEDNVGLNRVITPTEGPGQHCCHRSLRERLRGGQLLHMLHFKRTWAWEGGEAEF